MPVYRVTDGEKTTLVRAKTKAGAIAAVTKPKYSAEACSQNELIDRLQKGEKVIEADAKDETAE
jgi:hypothetical protein